MARAVKKNTTACISNSLIERDGVSDACRYFRRKTLAVAVSGALLALSTNNAVAASCTWNPATGNWGLAANWSCGIVPTGGPDAAIIAGGKSVTVDTGQSVLNLTNAGAINIDAFLLSLTGGGSTTNTGTINVGSAVTAALQVSAGHNIANTGGVINIANGSVVNQFGSTITGGTINTIGTGKLVVFNSGSNFLSGVALNGTLDLATGTGIQRIVNGLTLNGMANIGSGSIFATQGNQTITGSGAIVFADGNASNRFNTEAGNLLIDTGITVRGHTGFIGQQAFVGGTATLTNNGLIAADVSGGTITVDVNGGVSNLGTMKAANGGTLQLNFMGGNGVNNAGGTLLADIGSTVLLNSATVTGGVLDSNGSGRFAASSSGNNFLSGTTLNGMLDLASATSVARVTNGLTLNGTVNIGSGSVLAPQGNQTIGGNGSIVFADNNTSNRLNVEAGTLTLGSNITVRGDTGRIGQQAFVGGAATLVNNGTIQADVGGGTITLQVDGGGGVTNNGTLAALNGGTLLLNSNVANAVGSQILAGAGSTVVQNGVTLNGAINVNGTGSFRASNSGGNMLDTASFTGTLDLASATSVERVGNGLTLNGTVNIGSGSVLAPQGNQTIGGNGSIVFADNNTSNRLNVEAGTLTLGSNITVRGDTGRIGQQAFVGGAATLVNNGTIQADVGGGTITLQVDGGGGVTNNGTLAALNGGTLLLNSNVANAVGSQILAGAGSTVVQNGVTLNGAINVNGTGSFRASNSGNNMLDTASFTGTLDLASATSVERVVNGLTLNGTVNIGSGSVLAPQGNQTIGGNGSIVFADGNGSNRLNVEAGVLTLGPNITVRGSTGRIGQQAFAGGAATLVNNGTIQADVGGGTITLQVDGGGGVTNNGTLAALNGGTLLLNSNITNNGGGQTRAGVGGTVIQNGVTIIGAVNVDAAGSLRASNSGNNFLNAAALTGTLDLASAASVERVVNGLTLNGTVNIGSGSVLAPQGNQTIGGNGSIVFADGNGSNRLNVEAGNLVIGSGVTVRGQTGVIGQQAFVGGAATLVNNGTINSDGGGTITVNVTGSVTNNGTMRAQNGALNISNNLTGAGALQADAGGALNLANGGNTQGRLVMGGAGSAINIGNGNLTINNDYTNAGAGTGNAFNRRAGVSGAGQIVAGGDVSQVITGAGVTGGNTTNATLTIGNVRVGATTFDYQVGNAGTTGSILRGAIQTSVNGGNITDARLSGAGVTAANYNAGAPGANSGNLGVTFTAASAGALAPLTGQAINLRSNFENIADQKLNIVMAGGAAAYNAAAGSATPSPVTVANQRIGGGNTSTLTVANTASAGAFSEDLNAIFSGSTGAATGGGGISGRLAGTNNTGAGSITVGVDSTTAGAKTGTVTLNYQTAGAVNGVSNGLGTASAGSQLVNVSGNVFQLASGSLQTAPLNFGTLQVGQQISQNLVVRNTATGAAGFVEDLNASFGASGNSQITGSGSLSGIVAGNNSSGANGTMTVSVLGGSVGALNSSIAVNYFSAGAVNGVSNGLGLLGVGSESYGVNGTITAVGTVINQASPQINTPTINLGNVRMGAASPTANVSITNVATVAPQAALNASISGNAPITASGSFGLLDPGATNNSSLSVGMNTGTAGVVAGTATIALVSDASNVGGCAPNCQVGLTSQDVSVTGAVYRLASPTLNTPSVTIAARVGDPVSASQAVSITNTSPDIYTEGLKVAVAGTSGNAQSNGGSIANLAAQGTNSSAIQVGLASTATAGTSSGQVTLGLTSTGAGTTGAADITVGSAIIDVVGKVYQQAVAVVQNVVNFGTVHVGDVVAARGVSVQNVAPVAGLNDTLRADIGGATGPFTSNNGSVAGLAAGDAANATALAVGLNTAVAGAYSGSGSVLLTSQNPDMADLALGSQSIALNAQVNKYANAVFGKASGAGALSRSGSTFILDFGSLLQGSGTLSAIIDVGNLVAGGTADELNGDLSITDADDFAISLLLASFSNLAADTHSGDALSLLFDANTLALGSYQDSIDLSWFGSNASGYRDANQRYTLLVRGSVVESSGTVPEPGSLLLMLVALLGFGVAHRRRMP